MSNNSKKINQDRSPNFRDENGKLQLIRCFVCDPENGRENNSSCIEQGKCYWCGWGENYRHCIWKEI